MPNRTNKRSAPRAGKHAEKRPDSAVDRRPGSRPDTRQLRAIGHRLNPVVTIAGAGLSETVVAELERALRDHELIKIRLAVGDRDSRDALLAELLQLCGAELVQRIGNTALLLRQSAQPDPRKSNLLRPQA